MEFLTMATTKNRSGFVVPYQWDESRICQIKHKHGGFLRANPKNHEECSYKGGQTDWSKWKIYLHDNAQIIQIQNIKTKKYLEIDKHGKYIAVCNEGGLSSKFRLHSTTTDTDTQTNAIPKEDTTTNVIEMNGAHAHANQNETNPNDDDDDDDDDSDDDDDDDEENRQFATTKIKT
eukprot:109890_1